jgi:hypothetical protein
LGPIPLSPVDLPEINQFRCYPPKTNFHFIGFLYRSAAVHFIGFCSLEELKLYSEFYFSSFPHGLCARGKSL